MIKHFFTAGISLLCIMTAVNSWAEISDPSKIALHMISKDCPCFRDVTVVYGNGTMTAIQYKGEKTSGAAYDLLKGYLDKCSSTSSDDVVGSADTSGNGVDGTGVVSGMGYIDAIEDEIAKIMYINPDTITDSSEKAYQDNLNSVRENRNKIKFNAATRAIALGKRGTALATKSGEDIEKVKKEIEDTKDMLSLLRRIAQLEGQSLSKTNEITSMRAKLLEMSSIENIVASDVMTTQEKKK